MTCDTPNPVITRFRGDDDPHKMLITILKFGETIPVPLDLNLVTVGSIKFNFKAVDDTGAVVEYICVPDTDLTTGIIEIPFTTPGVNLAGDFDYTIKVTWKANNKIKTLVKNLLILEDDVN